MSDPGGNDAARTHLTGGRTAARSRWSPFRRVAKDLAAGRRRNGPWRVAVEETSMLPALEPGDWLLVDPTVRAWPRRGSVVVVREPGTDLLVVKRIAGRPGDEVTTPAGIRRLGSNEAWLLGDADGSHDSRAYGPVTLDRLIARAWFRYGPVARIGRIADSPTRRGRSRSS